MGGKTSYASRKKYNDKTYERITLFARMDSEFNKTAISNAAEEAGQSLNAYILEAIANRIRSGK